MPSRACALLLVLAAAAAAWTAAAQEEGFAETAPPKVILPMGDTREQEAESHPVTPEADVSVVDSKIAEVGKYWDQGENEAESAGGDAPPAPETAPDDPRAGMLFRGVMALCGTLALILVTYAAIKRWGQKTPMLAGQALGNVMGRLALTPHASLHFIRTNDEVLVIGVTQQSVSLLRTFDAADFAPYGQTGVAPEPAAGAKPLPEPSFLSQLKEAQGSMGMTPGVDEELDLLKGDLQRLKQYFQDSSRARE